MFFTEEVAAQGGETKNTTDQDFDTMVWRARERERLERSVPEEAVVPPPECSGALRRSSRVAALEEKEKAMQAERARSAGPARPKPKPRRRARSVVIVAPQEEPDQQKPPELPTWRDPRYCT